jgi:hypothetical protein
MENNLNQDPKSKIYDFSHHGIIPVLHATLWGSALYVAQKAGHVLGSTDDEKIALFQFGTIFVVLFLEILIVMFDVYIEQRANYFAPQVSYIHCCAISYSNYHSSLYYISNYRNKEYKYDKCFIWDNDFFQCIKIIRGLIAK